MIYLYVWWFIFTCVTWFICMCDTYKWVIAHVQMGDHTCKWILLNYSSQFVYMCGLSVIHLYACQRIYVFVWEIFSCEKRFVPAVLLRHMSWLFYTCDMTHPFIYVSTRLYVKNDSFPWYFSYKCHDSVICVIWLIHLYVWWPIHTCETIRSRGTSQMFVMSLLYVWYESFTYMCDDPFTRVKRFIPM